MPRALTSQMRAEINAGMCRPALFVEAEFTNGFARVWTGLGDITWGGYTWQGVGTLLGFSGVPETTELRAESVTLAMNGLDVSMVDRILTKCRQGKPVVCWLGMLDAAGAVVPDPTILFSGRMDVPTLDDPASDEVSAAVSVENRLRDFERTRERRFTDQDQRADYPTDRGGEYIAALQDWTGNVAGGGGRWGPGCPCADQFLNADVQVREARNYVGRKFDVLRDGLAAEAELLRLGGITMAPCVRLVAANGRAGRFSIDSPIELPGGRVVQAAEMEGEPMATDGGHGTPIEWSTIGPLEYLGLCEVLRLDFGGETFACGERPDGRLYTHNKEAWGE